MGLAKTGPSILFCSGLSDPERARSANRLGSGAAAPQVGQYEQIEPGEEQQEEERQRRVHDVRRRLHAGVEPHRHEVRGDGEREDDGDPAVELSNEGAHAVTAPIDGVVISRNVDVGNTVAVSLSAPTLFQIANDLRNMQIMASVAEADVGSVADGQSVNFTVDAYPDRKFHGRVVQIRSAPVTVQNVVTYNTMIDVRNDDLALKPGMTANVATRFQIKLEVLDTVKTQPPDELTQKNDIAFLTSVVYKF